MKDKNLLKRNYWIDILKIIACFCVIINHTGLVLLEYTNYKSIPVLVYSFMFAICKIGVPIFIMVTGYLLLNKKTNYKQTIRRIMRILIPLLFLSLFSYIKTNGISNFNILIFCKDFIKSPVITAFWYLYMLIGLYIVIPFVQKMVQKFNENDYKMFILLFLLIPSLIPLLSIYLNLGISSYFTMSFFPVVVAYLVVGVYLSKVKLNKTNLIIAILSFIISIIMFTLSLYIPFLNTSKISYILDSSFYITAALPAMATFYIIRYIFENRKLNKILIKIITEISLVTFGIYLFHPFILDRIYNLSLIQTIFQLSPYLGILALEIARFTICGIATFILRKIPFVKKFL